MQLGFVVDDDLSYTSKNEKNAGQNYEVGVLINKCKWMANSCLEGYGLCAFCGLHPPKTHNSLCWFVGMGSLLPILVVVVMTSNNHRDATVVYTFVKLPALRVHTASEVPQVSALMLLPPLLVATLSVLPRIQGIALDTSGFDASRQRWLLSFQASRPESIGLLVKWFSF